MSLNWCVVVLALGAVGALGRRNVRSAPTGHCIPARGETPGMAHNRSVLKERRILQTVPRRGRDGTSAGRTGGALRGIGPALAGRLGEGWGFRAARDGDCCSPPMLVSARSRCCWVLVGETKCCVLRVGTVMLRGRFLPVRGGVLRGNRFFYANLDCQPSRRACRRPHCG